MCLYSRFLYARKTLKLNNSVNIVTKLPESTGSAGGHARIAPVVLKAEVYDAVGQKIK